MNRGLHFIPCAVTLYSGHKGEERPRSLEREGRTVLLRTVRTMRIEEDHRSRERTRYFSALGNDGVTYVLRHDCAPDRWYVAASPWAPSGL